MLKANVLRRVFCVLVTSASLILCSLQASAADITYRLVQKSTLTNVNDSEGRWQFDGGDVYYGSALIGHYTRKKRVSFGIPTSINKSSMEMTILWKRGDYNFTVQGTHYFGSGREVGGVSATTANLSAFSDATFTGSHTSITVTY